MFLICKVKWQLCKDQTDQVPEKETIATFEQIDPFHFLLGIWGSPKDLNKYGREDCVNDKVNLGPMIFRPG